MCTITGRPTCSAAISAEISGAMPVSPEVMRPIRTLMPMITSRFASTTSTVSRTAISRESRLSPTMMRLEKAKMPA